MADVVDDALPVYIIGTFTNFHEEIVGHVCMGPSCQREAAVLVAGLYLGRVVVQRLCTTCASAQAIRWERPEKVRPPRRFQHQERPTASVSRARVVELFREGVRICDIAEQLSCSRSAVYNAIAQHRRSMATSRGLRSTSPGGRGEAQPPSRSPGT